MLYGALVGICLGVVNTLIFALQADTVDYGDWKTGVRAEGGSYSVLSFMRKAGQGVGGALAAFALGLGLGLAFGLGLGGYVSGAASQSGSAVTSIRVGAGAIPAVAMLAAAGVMLAYPLGEKALLRMVDELAARRAPETAASSVT